MRVVCPLCGKEFKRTPSELARGKGFCSRACVSASQRGVPRPREILEKMWAGQRAAPNRPLPPRPSTALTLTCRICGKTFTRGRAAAGRVKESFCSFACSLVAHRGEGGGTWKGDAATEEAGRMRARKLYPLGSCENCAGIGVERHHVDGNTLNNAPTNIRVLCVRCHRRTHAAAITHCRHGHPYDETNTYVNSNGRRSCRACQINNGRRYRALAKAAAS